MDSQNEENANRTIIIEKENDLGNTNDLQKSEIKTNEWLEHNNEFILNNNEIEINNNIDGNNLEKIVNNIDDDKTLHELLEQVAELDEIYSDHQIRRENLMIENELNNLDNLVPDQNHTDRMDIDEIFDDAATYTSLQRAFKNPLPMQEGPPIPQRPTYSNLNVDGDNYDLVEPPPVIVNPPAPVIDVTPLKREVREMKDEDEKLPPLPPKRVKKTPPSPVLISDLNKENNEDQMLLNNILSNHSRKSSTRSLTPRPQSQIIIMKSTEHLPPNKRLPPVPTAASSTSNLSANSNNPNTLKNKKSGGFFSKLFSRKKSKSDLDGPIHIGAIKNSDNNPILVGTAPTVEAELESSLLNFDLNDSTRGSIRSIKSLKSSDIAKKAIGHPVGRSVSSVSGKRPQMQPDIIHIPLKGDSNNSLPLRNGTGSGTHLSLPGNDAYERASTASLTNIDRKTMSALQLADLPIQDGNMELIAIADARSLKDLCEGDYGVQLDPSVDLTEAEHYALYTSVAPHATASEFDEASAYYAPVEAGEILTPAEVARRLTTNIL